MASIHIGPVVDRWGVRLVVAVCACATLTGVARAADPTAGQRAFASPDEAAAALVDALQRDDVAALRAIFGPESDKLLSSGDEVEDAAARKRVADAVAQAMRVEPDGDARAELILGTDDWPFPVPMVKTGATWRFDTAAVRTRSSTGASGATSCGRLRRAAPLSRRSANTRPPTATERRRCLRGEVPQHGGEA